MSAPRCTHRYEMAITRDEFVRLLPFAVETADGDERGSRLRGRDGGVDWQLSLVERPPRRIASLSLPVLDVTLECRAAHAADVDRFVERFLRAYQRGGG